MTELEALYSRVRTARPELHADLGLIFSQLPSDVAVNAPIVQALDAALRASGNAVQLTGMSAWTDAALLNNAGIPAICFGPGDISLAHAAEEYIQIDEIRRATDVLTAMAQDWCRE
jgi:acetylornithine deacetylase